MSGYDETDAVARVEEGRVDWIPGNTSIPVVCRLARDHTAEAATAIKPDLAEALTSVGAAADTTGVCVEDIVGSPNYGGAIDLVGKADAWPELMPVEKHRRTASAAVRTVTGELESAQNIARNRVANILLKNVCRSSVSWKGVQTSQRRPILTVRLGVAWMLS